MELSLAVNNSLLKLHHLGIYCTEPFRIPYAGKLRICCFDKTGTLTSDEMTVLGVAAAAPAEGGGGVDSALVSAADAPEETSLVLAGCQQLVVVDGELLGDPMERAALQAAGWLFAAEGVCVCRQPGKRASMRILQRYPFASELRRSSTVVALERFGGPPPAAVRAVKIQRSNIHGTYSERTGHRLTWGEHLTERAKERGLASARRRAQSTFAR